MSFFFRNLNDEELRKFNFWFQTHARFNFAAIYFNKKKRTDKSQTKMVRILLKRKLMAFFNADKSNALSWKNM